MTARPAASPGPAAPRPAPEAIEDAVERVAGQLADPRRVTRYTGRAEEFPGATRPDSLENHAGVALLLAGLAGHDRAWLRPAHAHITTAAEALSHGTVSGGLHMGPAAVLAAVQACAPYGGHYPRLRRRLVAHVADEQRQQVAVERTAAVREGGVRWAMYDAIAGLSGTGRLLLTALLEGGDEERGTAGPALRETLTLLVELSRPVTVRGREVPGWWVPSRLLVLERDRERCPLGEFNVGLAHGISGPLALLALCTEHGVTVPGQDGALHRIGDWLVRRARTDGAGPYWPARIAFEEETADTRPAEGAAPPPEVPRPSWCYGAPGIASALHRAGRVTGTPAWQHLALAALHALPRRDHAPDPLPDALVCHGRAGLLQVAWRLGRTTGDVPLLDQAGAAGARVLELADAEAPFGFPPAQRPVAGILQGAAGIAAALLSLVADDRDDRQPYWDRVLLLS
ncbi:lanthionine synthetase C family protein [Streptomyces sp. NPDC052114]|uniref:lanthionine synthetase C family protein n=1 Tax=unclassified Streptomyces TaxID=2593676 RepID=UPI00344AE859